MKMGSTLWLWVVTLLVLLGNGCCCFGCMEQERISLLHLKANINYPNGTSLPSWVDDEASGCCQWVGVECNNTTRRVILLSLYSKREQTLGDWYFNASLFLPFEELRTLDLYHNSLVGWVENAGFDKLSRLSNLEVLDLSFNHFSSNILSSLSGISSLKSLNLLGNDLKGSIQFTNDFINLKELDLSYNNIEKIETIQGLEGPSILSNLEVLKLRRISFTNSTLTSLSGLSSLKSLDLTENQVNGSIHINELDGRSNLEELDMSWNNIANFINTQGKKSLSQLKVLHLNDIMNCNASSLDLLQSLGAFSSLKTLYFQNNNVEGTIASQGLRNLINLEDLILDSSSLNKNFLQSIQVLTSLKVLSLVGCGLNGTLPARGWCELKNLEELLLNGNHLEGILPPCLGNLTTLRVIDLSDNHFTGKIASSPLSTLTSLEYLSFSYNQFQFPSSFMSFSNHSNLKVIFCSHNKLVEEPMIHSWTPKFQLKVLSMSNCTSNDLNVAPPNFLYYQSDLRIADLSQNKFSGSFPTWLLENNTRLESLYLRENSFVGTFGLPTHLNPNLLVLDISNNNIQGHIPANLSSFFPNLKALNMSRNEFQGNLISGFNDLNSLWLLDLSNNHLSGVITEHVIMRCPANAGSRQFEA